MQSIFGWTLLSRDALRRAETQLRDEVEGVRDEIGFLSLHQGYADRFFPGTSVLHTRLRYVLFVPWIYEKISQQSDRKQISTSIEKQELELTRRLKEAGEKGVIGIRSYPNPTAQPPCMTYWSALGAWRILRTSASGSIPSRQTVHRSIGNNKISHLLQDDDKELLFEGDPLFCSLPKPPSAWNNSAQRLDFRLQASERKFLRSCLLAVSRPGSNAIPSLMSRMVEKQIEISERSKLLSSSVLEVADQEDRQALMHANQAAALSAVGRGIYAALVEKIREEHDSIPTENIHRANLSSVVDEFSDEALKINVNDIVIDIPTIAGSTILDVLQETQSWLRNRNEDLLPLYEIYERAETIRKGRRARLSKTLLGRERRMEWIASDHPYAEPLHYRWKNVKQLLMDLQEVS